MKVLVKNKLYSSIFVCEMETNEEWSNCAIKNLSGTIWPDNRYNLSLNICNTNPNCYITLHEQW